MFVPQQVPKMKKRHTSPLEKLIFIEQRENYNLSLPYDFKQYQKHKMN